MSYWYMFIKSRQGSRKAGCRITLHQYQIRLHHLYVSLDDTPGINQYFFLEVNCLDLPERLVVH